MSGCSLVAAGLPSLVGTATPTFSYNPASHLASASDNFGIQMTYMSGTSTCYSGTRPTFTPVISNPALLYTRTCQYVTQGAPATYTGIFCTNADLNNWINSGAYTIDNYVAFNQLAQTPHEFIATFGTSPAASTVATSTVSVTSTRTQTATAVVQPAATTTLTSASATTTRTSTSTSTVLVTSSSTQIISSCSSTSPTSVATTSLVSSSRSSSSPASSSPPVASSSVSSSAPVLSSSSSPSPMATTTVVSTVTPSTSPAATTTVVSTTTLSPSSTLVATTSSSPSASATNISCPESNGKIFNGFTIECFVDRTNFDMGIASSNPATYAQCIQACASTSGCQAVSYLPNGPCYLKSGIGAPNVNNNVWGASLVGAASSSSSSSSSVASSTATASSTASPTPSVTCPGSDGQNVTISGSAYRVECSADYFGGDIPGPASPVYPGSYEGCLAACTSTFGCIAASYVINGPCYLKNAVTGRNTNSNIIGGRLISTITATSIPATATITATSISATATIAATSISVTAAISVSTPSTVTVTTTISSTAYQCACTPTSTPSSFGSSGALSCPASNGATYITPCGAQYVIECGADRYGNDIANGLTYTNNLEACLAACDITPGCVDVSWVIGTPGACYMKGSAGAVRQNSNIYGGRQVSGCTSSKLKLHRKRVAPVQPKKPLGKRAGYFGPDFTFTQPHVTATQTSTAFATVLTTSTPPNSGTATSTAFTLASATITTTTSVSTTVYNIVSITTCPTASASV